MRCCCCSEAIATPHSSSHMACVQGMDKSAYPVQYFSSTTACTGNGTKFCKFSFDVGLPRLPPCCSATDDDNRQTRLHTRPPLPRPSHIAFSCSKLSLQRRLTSFPHEDFPAKFRGRTLRLEIPQRFSNTQWQSGAFALLFMPSSCSAPASSLPPTLSSTPRAACTRSIFQCSCHRPASSCSTPFRWPRLWLRASCLLTQ